MVGMRIKEHLTENGIKQSFLAQKVGLTPSQMSDICSGERRIDCVTYYKICLALGVPFEQFLEGEEE